MTSFVTSVKYAPANSSEEVSDASPPPHRPWQPGFLRRLPWAGVVSIIFALGCAVAAVTVGVVSDGKPLDYWTVNGYALQPAVLFSIFATAANALLVFAFTEGATIHWWNMAFKGATLKHLHSSYHYGSGLTAVFSSVTSFNRVALASLLMPVLLMDGPLLQRASNVVQRTQESHARSVIPITASPFILGATGIIPDHEVVASMYHPLFAQILREYTNREPVLLPNRTCDGTCSLEVVAPGWDIECSETSEKRRFATFYEGLDFFNTSNRFPNGTERPNSTYNGPRPDQRTFSVETYLDTTDADVPLQSGSQHTLGINISYKSTPGDQYTLTRRSCRLGEAVVKYPVNLQNGTVTLRPMPRAVNRTVYKVYRQFEMHGQGDYPSTLGGFMLALSSHYRTRATMGIVASWYAIRSTTPVSSQYLRAPNASAIATAEVWWEDPMDDMISMAHELAFRTAHKTSSEVPDAAQWYARHNFFNLTTEQPYILSPNLTTTRRTVQQEAVVSSSTLVTVYATQRGWLAGGFVVICLGCLAIAPTYWGWWRLGREVSMSPLEIARAFEAPVLQDADPNATGDDLKKALGHRKVCFGPRRDGVEVDSALHREGDDAAVQ